MPRYYFDEFDGTRWAEDEIGTQCQDDDDAQKNAYAALVDLARDEIPQGGQRIMRVRVRDGMGALFETSLTLDTVSQR